MIFLLRHSTKLHIFGARASTVAVISRTILAFSLAAYDSYHFVRRVLPWRLTSKRKLIMAFCAARGGARLRCAARLHALCLASGAAAAARALALARGYWQCVRVAKTRAREHWPHARRKIDGKTLEKTRELL